MRTKEQIESELKGAKEAANKAKEVETRLVKELDELKQMKEVEGLAEQTILDLINGLSDKKISFLGAERSYQGGEGYLEKYSFVSSKGKVFELKVQTLGRNL
jgi:hypothetical protein